MEKSLTDLCKKAAARSNGRIVEKASYSCTTGCPVAWFNKAFGFDLAHRDPRALLDELCEDVRLGRAPPSLVLNGLAQAFLSERLLGEVGFERFYEQTGMVLDLEGWEPEARVNGHDCRPIAEKQDLQDWMAVLEEAFGDARDAAFYGSLMEDPDIRLFGGYAAGRVVSTALLNLQDGIAGIHSVATRRDCRGAGRGTAVTAAALRFARAARFPLAALQASPMGRGVYARMGFSECSKVFHWRATEALRPKPRRDACERPGSG